MNALNNKIFIIKNFLKLCFEKINFKKNKTQYLVFSLFLLITFYGLINHDPWRDEAQAWLIARDLNFFEILKQMRYEGTPPLWHIILLPLAKLGLPYASEFIIHYLIAITLIFLLIFFSPLPKIFKIILPFSYYFLFEYTIIARNYNLSILLLFLIALFYKQKTKKPILFSLLIFLLSWTNIHCLAIAGLIFILFIKDIIKERIINKSTIIAATTALIGFVSIIFIIAPWTNKVDYQTFTGWLAASKAFSLALLPQLANKQEVPIQIIILSLCWVPIIFFLLKTRLTKFIFLISCSWLLYIFLYKYPAGHRHAGLILVFFIFLWWLDKLINKKPEIKNDLKAKAAQLILLIFLLNSIPYAAYLYITIKFYYFSGAKEMAQIIKSKKLDNYNIVAYPSYSATALLPFLPNKKFYQIEVDKESTYITWDDNFFKGSSKSYPFLKERMINYYKKNYPQEKIVLILTTWAPNFDKNLKLLAKNSLPTINKDEFFYLYSLKIE